MEADIVRTLEVFEQISRIPRCSKNEEAVARWFEVWAGSHGWPSRRDPAGNLLIRVPATAGCERAPVVVIQGHLDMVCEKTPESPHDFSRDPIRIVREGDWIRADATTLGADNGVALALGAAIAEDPSVRHPPLELLFTVDEENGLTGAKKLAPGFVEGRILINLDSETDGVFTVGCAGGKDVQIQRAVRFTPISEAHRLMRVTVGGLTGGHSGIDIHRPRANAISLLARLLDALIQDDTVRLMAAAGGTRRNAIPRDAWGQVACPAGRAPALQGQVAEWDAAFRAEFPCETALGLSIAEAQAPASGPSVMSLEDGRAIVNLLLALPHGIAQMAPDFSDLVHTSSNLAITETTADGQKIVTSQRSLSRLGLDAMSGRVRAAAALAGGRAHTESEYPPWTPNPASPLLARCRDIYRRLYRKDPEVRALHAGLECALIGDIYPGMDMISLGPTTENAHSPTERLHVPSLANVKHFLAALLKSMAET
jgi:dipeptidase D